MAATADEARLIVEFSNWAQTWGFHPANRWVVQHRSELKDYEQFQVDHPAGSDGHTSIYRVLGYYENIGLFYKHEAINRDLLFDWLDFCEPWSIVADYALAERAAGANPTLWANFELLATDQRKYMERPGSDGRL